MSLISKKRKLVSATATATATAMAAACIIAGAAPALAETTRSGPSDPANPASADNSTPQDASSTSNPSATDQNGEIIVTASRYGQSVQKVPAAITAISGADISERGIVNTADLQLAVPSLAVGTQNGVSNISIRGVGLNVRQGAPGVGIYVDDVYQPHPVLGDLTQIDLARVEVLRGPQGTLYGRNTTGGAVSFFSNAPTQGFNGWVMGTYESYDQYRLQAGLNLPLSGSWAIRGVIDYNDRNNGFQRNLIAGLPDADFGSVVSGRVRLAGDITDTLKLNLAYTRQVNDGSFDYEAVSNAPSVFAVANAPILGTATVTTQPFRTTINTPTDGHRDYASYAGTLTLALPFGDLKSVTSYQTYRDQASYDGDGTNADFVTGYYRNSNKTFTQEVLLSSQFGPVRLVTGLFYMDDKQVNSNIFTFPNGFGLIPPTGAVDFEITDYTTKAYAAYADGTINLTPKLRLIAGARYSIDKQKISTGGAITVDTPIGRIPVVTLCAPYTANLRFESFTPRGGLQYDVGDNSNLYGTVSRGFKSGGANGAGCPNFYAPEEVTSFEIGSKNHLFNNTLTLNASAFWYDYKNLQVNQIIGLAPIITNAASAEVKGVELETVYTPNSNWSFNANVTYLDANYKSFTNLDGLNILAGPQDLSGNRLNFSPEWSINSGLAYTTDKFSWGSVQLRGDVSYRSRTFFREFNTPLDGQAPYALVNLNLQWSSANNLYRLRLFANNLTNKGAVVTVTSSESIGSRTRIWNTPRQLGAEMRIAF